MMLSPGLRFPRRVAVGCFGLFLLIGSATSRLPAANPEAELAAVPVADIVAFGKVNKAITKPQPTAADRFSRTEVIAWLRVRALTQGNDVGKALSLFRDVYPEEEGQKTFTALEVKQLDQQKYSAPDPGPTPTPPPKTPSPFHLHLRQSFSDVLLSEDPTQQPTNQKFDDLKGALISYTRDLKANHDTWATQAALIGSLVVDPKSPTEVDRWTVTSWGLIPSVSLHRETTSGKTAPGVSPANEIDQLAYRLGVFGKFSTNPTDHNPLKTVTVRGFGTYVTDTGHESSVPAGQFELEPQLFFNFRGQESPPSTPLLGRYKLAPLDNFAIGYQRALIYREAIPEEHGTEQDLDPRVLAYQIRLRLRGEYGNVADAGKIGVDTGAFLRGGAIAELKLDPFFSKRIVLNLSYSYLPSLFGPDQHHTLFTAGVEWRILNDKEKQQILTLQANYTRGGIDVTQQRINTLKLGLGATF